MTPSQVLTELHTIFTAGKVPFIHGATGIGKSQVMLQYCEANDLEMRDIRASQLDPVDARGIPHANVKQRLTEWFPPDFLPYDPDSSGVLFLDELNKANQDTLAALYQLILERRIGDYILPPHWHIAAAGNRDIDGCMVQPMPRALKNRFIHLLQEVHHPDWHDWAHTHEIIEHVIAFLKFRPTALDEATESTKDETGERQKVLQNANAIATPRSWEFVSDLLKAAFSQDRNLIDCYSLIEGTVGEGMASEFIAYCDIYMELPDLDELIKDPSLYNTTNDPSKLYAICTGLAARADGKTFGNIKKVLDQMAPEYAHWTVDDCISRNRDEIAKHPAYRDWVTANMDYVV